MSLKFQIKDSPTEPMQTGTALQSSSQGGRLRQERLSPSGKCFIFMFLNTVIAI